MLYPDIAPNTPNGQWVEIPNTRFDAKVGHKLYQEYLDELVWGDELGIDGLMVNEHHATFYSLMPSCTVIAAALVARTKKANICVFGTPITLGLIPIGWRKNTPCWTSCRAEGLNAPFLWAILDGERVIW